MTEDQADKIIDLLDDISRKLDDVYSALQYADNSDVVSAIDALKREVKKINR